MSAYVRNIQQLKNKPQVLKSLCVKDPEELLPNSYFQILESLGMTARTAFGRKNKVLLSNETQPFLFFKGDGLLLWSQGKVFLWSCQFCGTL